MDGNRFDELAKSLSSLRSRRAVLRALGVAAGAAVVAAVGRDQTGEAVTCRAGGDICRKNGDCCSNLCGPRDATGRQRCACAAPTTPCGTDCCEPTEVCINGVCRIPTPTPTPTATPTPTPTPTPTATPTVVPTTPDQGTCAAGANYCAIGGSSLTCGDGSCKCLQLVSGGTICAQSDACSPTCTTDVDCPAGQFCANTNTQSCCGAASAGVPPACVAPCSPPIQGTCASNADYCAIGGTSQTCGGGSCKCLQRVGGAGAVCAANDSCSPTCATDADCGVNQVCALTNTQSCCGAASAGVQPACVDVCP